MSVQAVISALVARAASAAPKQALLQQGAPPLALSWLTATSAHSRDVPARWLATAAAPESDSQRKALAAKLLYRSKQRGFLELDLLVGLWAERHIPALDVPQLNALAEVLDQENPDLFKWLTGQLPAPEHILRNPAFVMLKRSAEEQLAQRSHGASRAEPGKEWVRGWDDGWRNSSKQSVAAGGAAVAAAAPAQQ